MLPNSFYMAFGNLLYAVAMSDSEVQLEEINAFYQITRDELQKLSDDPEVDINHFNSLLSDSGFLNSYHADLTSQIALNKFLNYYNAHPEIFTDWVKEFCLTSVYKVADAFDGIVSEEKLIIMKLNNAFDNK